jgi:hypothetical protein
MRKVLEERLATIHISQKFNPQEMTTTELSDLKHL